MSLFSLLRKFYGMLIVLAAGKKKLKLIYPGFTRVQDGK